MLTFWAAGSRQRRPYRRVPERAHDGNPDHLAKSGRKAVVEGVRDRRVLTDGTRTVEIRPITGILHADDMLLVYLPKEKFLIEADAYTPPPPNTAPMSPPNPFNISLLENVTKQSPRGRPDSSAARAHGSFRGTAEGGRPPPLSRTRDCRGGPLQELPRRLVCRAQCAGPSTAWVK
jgi:hypothetical protein